MRYGFWLPVFGGWLRNIDDEQMPATWDYVRELCALAEDLGYDLTLTTEKSLDTPRPGDFDEIAEAMFRIHCSGWSIGDAGFVGKAGVKTWLAIGRNGENLLRAEGATEVEAWRRALDEARALGMLV